MKSLMKYLISLLLQCMLFLPLSIKAQDPNFHIYLCFGQSNMDGTGTIENQDKVTNSRVKMLQDQTCSNLGRNYGTWYTAVPPLSRCWNGLGPADYFGKEMASNMPANVTIGLVVTGYGGCDIAFFQKGAPLGKASIPGGSAADIPAQFTGGYAWMLDLAKKAQTVGVIKGMIFHQGETNTNDPNWKYKVQEIVNNLRTDLGIGNVPFLAGELLYSQYGGCCSSHNTEINKLPGLISNCQVVSTSGLAGKDNAHFTSTSYRELGIRYAQKMIPLININSIPIPVVTITAPVINSSLCSGASVNIEAVATINSGSVSKVEFYDGVTLLGTDTSFPYAFLWETPSAGSHTLKAIATSAANVVSDAAVVSVTVNSPTIIVPVMQLKGGAWSEQSTAQLCEGGDLGIGPHPYDIESGWSWQGPDGFSSTQREIRLSKIAPLKAGVYKVSFTNASGCKSSLEIPITVYAKPGISIVSPVDKEILEGSSIAINVDVTGSGISNVQYYDGSSFLTQKDQQPYSYIWNQAPAGKYKLLARAVNINGCSDTATAEFVVAVSTGLTEEAVEQRVSFYPNPFNDYATLQAKEGAQFLIVDLLGKIVERGAGKSEIHIGETLSQGVYFLRISMAGEDKVIKITKR